MYQDGTEVLLAKKKNHISRVRINMKLRGKNKPEQLSA